MGPTNVNMRSQTIYIILSFFLLFCYTKLCTDPHVNKDFLFKFLAKTVYHVPRQELFLLYIFLDKEIAKTNLLPMGDL